MKLLTRYIAKAVIAATTIVIVVMLALIFIINLLAELKDVGNGDYSFIPALVHVVLELPHNLYQFFPMLMLLGGVISLGILSSHQELIVMRAAGFSVRKIASATLLAALALTLIATGIGEWLGPKGYYLAEQRKDSEQNGGQAVATLTGVWLHENNDFLHVNRVVGLSHLEGVTRYHFDNQHHLLATYFIKSMDLQQGQWHLHQGVKTTFKNNQTSSQTFEEGQWDLALNPHLLDVGMIEPAEMSLRVLYNYSQHYMQNTGQAISFRLEFWKRIFQPITTMIMILMAIPFVIRSSRSLPMGVRVLFGISVGFVFYILNAFLSQFSIVYQFSPMWAAITPTLLFALLGYVFSVKFKT